MIQTTPGGAGALHVPAKIVWPKMAAAAVPKARCVILPPSNGQNEPVLEDHCDPDARLKGKTTNPWIVGYCALGMYIESQGSQMLYCCEMDMVEQVKSLLAERISKPLKLIFATAMSSSLCFTIYYLVWLFSLRYDVERQQTSQESDGYHVNITDWEITKFFLYLFVAWVLGLANVVIFLEPRLLPTFVDENDSTPLHIAVKYNSFGVAKYLLESYCKEYNLLGQKDINGDTPYDCARKKGNLKFVELMNPYLQRNGAVGAKEKNKDI